MTPLQIHKSFAENIDFDSAQIKRISFRNFKQQRSIDLMSSLAHCAQRGWEPIDFLLISDDFYRSFIICYDVPSTSHGLPQYGCTLTQLKRMGTSHLLDGRTCKIGSSVFVPRFNEKFHIWKRPYLIRAQTHNDTNYGNYYEDGYLHEGNQYGDTSSFFILGWVYF